MAIEATKGKRNLMITPIAMTNSATATANLDCRGADYATIEFTANIEKNTNGKGLTISVLESDDTVVTNFATFDSNFEVTSAVDQAVTAKHYLYGIDTKARKRYLRLSLSTGTTTNDDLTVSAIGTTWSNEQAPASTSDIATVVVLG